METLRSNANSIKNYPSKETMELFLKIWSKIGLFDTVKESNWTLRYKNVNAIITLSIICDYLCLPGKEQERDSFLEELEQNNESIYKRMWELALDIWEWKWNLSPFSQSMLDSDRKRLKEIKSNIYCFPIIADKDNFPDRITNIRWDTIINKDFETELSRVNWVTESADKIQAEFLSHNFEKSNNSTQIKDLKNKL